ncbi:MAG: sugar ABC transporter permease [Clostridiales bacterium]|jgi:multiple sugar transport system permease protein|nr:sugar ABC transporter permease [Clostridiales bacterium]MDR2749096.1 sugar ABC transporter permease [Clostridiales bacterium]
MGETFRKKIMAKPQNQKVLVAVTFLFIPLVLLGLFTYLPFAKMIQFSFYDMRYIGKRTFVGLDNYISVFSREDLFNSLKLSIYYLGASIVQLGLALFFATILSFKTKLGGIFKGVMFFPYLVSGIAIGFIFKFFFTRGFVLDSLLVALGLTQENLPYWLRDQSVNNVMLAATSVWRYMGQNMVLFIGAIMSVDPDLYEAAAIDGSNAWNRFWSIILPSIKTIVALNLILSISGSISAFEPPYVITNGTFGTGTYFVMMNSMAHEKQKVGLAASMAVVLMVLIILATLFQKLIVKIFFEEDKNGMTFSERSASKRRLANKSGLGGVSS